MGASGNVGSAVVESLRERGVEIRAVSRRDREWPAGVEGVVADPGVPDGLNEAAAGVDGVFLLSGYAAEAGLLSTVRGKPVAVLSASSAVLGDGGNAMAAYHLATERGVQASGCPGTIVRPCSLQSNLLRWRTS